MTVVLRRKLLRKVVGGALLIPLVQLSPPAARAQALKKVPISDPVAAALKYVEDAAQASRTDKYGIPGDQQLCSNCQLYSATANEPGWGSCTLFQNRLVSGPGWCSAWVPVRR